MELWQLWVPWFRETSYEFVWTNESLARYYFILLLKKSAHIAWRFYRLVIGFRIILSQILRKWLWSYKIGGTAWESWRGVGSVRPAAVERSVLLPRMSVVVRVCTSVYGRGGHVSLFHSVYIGHGHHPTCHRMAVRADRPGPGIEHHDAVLRLRMHGVMPPLCHAASWHDAKVSKWMTLPFIRVTAFCYWWYLHVTSCKRL